MEGFPEVQKSPPVLKDHFRNHGIDQCVSAYLRVKPVTT
jgi:hypothetical protein